MIATVTPPPCDPRTQNPANEAAIRILGRPYLSWSAVSTFAQCPLKFRFRYVDRLPEESVSASLVFGSAVHAAIEDFYRAHLAGEARPDVDRLLFTYRSAWLASDLDQVTFGSSESKESLDRLAEKMLRAFLASDLAHETPRVLAVEEQLQGQIVPGVPDVLARLDLVTEDDDSLVITDFKTSRGKWSPEQAEESAGQLLLYSELAKEYDPGKKVTLAFTVLTKTASPTIERHAVEVTPDKVARTKKIFERVWAAIQSGIYFPAPSVMNCSGCGFRTACRVWAG